MKFIKDSSAYGKQVNDLFDGLETNIRKLLGDMETFTKHSHYIANDFAKMHDGFSKMGEKCRLKNV